MKDKNITISLSEYKELLLKERPSDNDKWLLEKIKTFIAENTKLDSDYKDITIKDSYDFARDILKFIKLVDMDFYKSIVKKCYDKKLEEEETKLRVEKMNAIKELNKEQKNNE
jgi:hypothetical protein